MPRFQALLAGDEGRIEAQLAFNRDEENRPVVSVEVSAQVQVTCQRCLQPMPLALNGAARLGIVWTDEQARHLPRDLDPLVVGEEGCNLWDIVEEELILLMPPYSYHETQDCKQILSEYSADVEPPMEPAPEKPNPFAVLAQLKQDEEPRS
ncbi:YceD family protein [Mangrovimicrobium sediminis]|uniref:YceD family protein n=1 Tax=Mangrovimicrobium sediminis TaxID=2562682 RepID=UPI00143697F6|nr:YceD family protein [Haliea sp. SAOS-164]